MPARGRGGRQAARGTLSLIAAGFAAGLACAAVVALAFESAAQAPVQHDPQTFAALKARFKRPEAIPFPDNNPFSEAKRTLGEKLFFDKRLSIDRSLSCASCHDPAKGFADGRERGIGVPGRLLGRHSPSLWNLAGAPSLFWDGRARSLEQQIAGPIEAADEMGQPISGVVNRLSGDSAMVSAFRLAFPEKPEVNAENLARAIATYERTLVSPLTRFDRWIDGDDRALTKGEVAGFRLFTGKGGCANCHSGFAFTDFAFHDIGLPGEDRGRGAVLRLPEAEHAFKTPSLRELTHAAPYMHDGSFKTLADVIAHYERGIVERPTLSQDLPRGLVLTSDERANLLAFLRSLSSEGNRARPAPIVPGRGEALPDAARVATISQHDKTFSQTHIMLHRGEKLWFLNNDTRTHNIRIFDPALDFDSGAQEPGETVEIEFPASGSFLVFCGIHPKMEVRVEVTD